MATKNVAANTSRAAAKAAKATPKAVVKSQLGADEQVSIAIANIRKLNPRRYYRHSARCPPPYAGRRSRGTTEEQGREG